MIYDEKKLENFKITPNQLLILNKIDNNEDIELFFKKSNISILDLQYLIRKDFLILKNKFELFTEIELSKLGKDVLSVIFEKKTSNELEWLEDWRNGFGELKSGAKGSKQGCYKKMNTFLKKFPNITIEQIFQARDLYFNKLDNIKYLQQADYFIEKNGTSRLEQYIEMLSDEDNISKWENVI